jgi:hypothetical protein
VLLDAAAPAAGGAWIGDDFAGAVAARTGLLDGKKSLLLSDLTVTVAGRAGARARAGLRPAALANFTLLHRRDADAGFGAARRLLQRNFQVVSQVSTAINARPGAAGAEDIAKDVAESVGEPAKTGAGASRRRRIDAGVTVLVVGGTLVRFRQYFVGFLCFLEALFGLGVIRIAVRMVFHREFAVRLLDLLLRRIPVHTEYFVIVFFCHNLWVRGSEKIQYIRKKEAACAASRAPD